MQFWGFYDSSAKTRKQDLKQINSNVATLLCLIIYIIECFCFGLKYDSVCGFDFSNLLYGDIWV